MKVNKFSKLFRKIIFPNIFSNSVNYHMTHEMSLRNNNKYTRYSVV